MFLAEILSSMLSINEQQINFMQNIILTYLV